MLPVRQPSIISSKQCTVEMDTRSGVPLRYYLEILSNEEALPSLTPHALVADLFPYCLPDPDRICFLCSIQKSLEMRKHRCSKTILISGPPS